MNDESDYMELFNEVHLLRSENRQLAQINQNLLKAIENIGTITKDDLQKAFDLLDENKLDRESLLQIADNYHYKINTTSKF